MYERKWKDWFWIIPLCIVFFIPSWLHEYPKIEKIVFTIIFLCFITFFGTVVYCIGGSLEGNQFCLSFADYLFKR